MNDAVCHIKKTLICLSVFLLLLSSCGQERPPADEGPSLPSGPIGETSELERLMERGLGDSKAFDYSPCEGIRVFADENAFYEDTIVDIQPVNEDTPAFGEIEQLFYDQDFLIFSAFEVDAGLSDDEFIADRYKVCYDLSTTDIDPAFYDYLSVYRVGDDGEYYELDTWVDEGILKFSCNQNSLIVTGILLGLLGCSVGYVGYSEYKDRNAYYLDNKKEVMSFKGKNDYGTYVIETAIEDVDPRAGRKEVKVAQIIERYVKEAEEELRDTKGVLSRLRSNQQMASYLKQKLEADAEFMQLKKDLEYPDLIQFTIKCIEESFKYLEEVEHLRMPLHTIYFKNVNDGKNDFGNAVNRYLSASYIEIRLGLIDQKDKNDYYNLLLTIVHELLHICQNRYRLPVDFMTDSVRYDEMIALVTEEKAKSYFKANGTIPADADPPITSIDHWNELRLPINGENDSAAGSLETRNRMRINSGYNLGSFLDYLFGKVGKRPDANTMMFARSYGKWTNIIDPVKMFMGISDREFDIHFRNWAMNNRYRVGDTYLKMRKDGVYKMPDPIAAEAGKKYHIDLDHGGNYFMTIRTFRSTADKQMMAVVVPDPDLREVFPSSNVAPAITYSSINAGGYIEDFRKYGDSEKDLLVLEVQGDESKADLTAKAGYTVYVLDKTPKVKLELGEEKLAIKLPEPDEVMKDKVADGYILKVTSDSGKKSEIEIGKDELDRVLEIKKSAIYGEDKSKDVTITAVLTEFFMDSEGKKYPGISSDPVKIKIEGQEVKQEPEPEPEPIPVPDISVPADVGEPAVTSVSLVLTEDGLTDFYQIKKEPPIVEISAYPGGNSYTIQGDRITFNITPGDFTCRYDSGSAGGTMSYVRGGFTVSGNIVSSSGTYISGTLDSLPQTLYGSYVADTYWIGITGDRNTTYRKEETTINNMDPSSSWFDIYLDGDGNAQKARIELKGHVILHAYETQNGEQTVDHSEEKDLGISILLGR